MKHILLTGATGFLGSHLLEALLKQGYTISVLKRSTSDVFRISHLLDRVKTYDIDRVPIYEAFKASKVDAVIHTACAYGRHDQPAYEVVETNVVFALKVLEAAISTNTALFVNTDTFFNAKDSVSNYLNTYSLSKKHFSEWLKTKSDSIKVVNLKIQHMYGPKDDLSKFIPWLINQLQQDVERVPLTDGAQQRDFIYVDDVVSAYMLTLRKIHTLPTYTEFDVGTGELTSVRDFVNRMYETYKKINPDTKTQLGFGDIEKQSGEIVTAKSDSTFLKSLGWKINTKQVEALERIMNDTK